MTPTRLDSQGAFPALPAPVRLRSNLHFTGRGVTVAMVDSGFYPHPDLVEPRNRIRAWVDATHQPVRTIMFTPHERPRWPGWNAKQPWQWHGLMTSAVAAGNGRLSGGLYRGLASDADLVLIHARGRGGGIRNQTLCRSLEWLGEQGAALGVRVINLSVGGDAAGRQELVDRAAQDLVKSGITVVAAAGNDEGRALLPPAAVPEVITVGGLDDGNGLDPESIRLWHGSYGRDHQGRIKPDLVAPSVWLAAPMLPGSEMARAALQLFTAKRKNPRRVAQLKLVTPYYQHVDGTSFASALVAATVACMLEANGQLTPEQVRRILIESARPISSVPRERQGAGALDPSRAMSLAVLHRGK